MVKKYGYTSVHLIGSQQTETESESETQPKKPKKNDDIESEAEAQPKPKPKKNPWTILPRQQLKVWRHHPQSSRLALS